MKKHLVIMAKAPLLGRVKTRLAKDIGPVKARAFYKNTLARISRTLARNPHWVTWLSVSPDLFVFKDRLWPERCNRISQGRGDLGDRMQRVMNIMPAGPVVLIGADIPDITPDHIQDAFDALGKHDVVFGPADDGGYWLVGQKRRPKTLQLFKNVRWSSAHALADTQHNLPTGSTFALLETLPDIDTAEDYHRFLNR